MSDLNKLFHNLKKQDISAMLYIDTRYVYSSDDDISNESSITISTDGLSSSVRSC